MWLQRCRRSMHIKWNDEKRPFRFTYQGDANKEETNQQIDTNPPAAVASGRGSEAKPEVKTQSAPQAETNALLLALRRRRRVSSSCWLLYLLLQRGSQGGRELRSRSCSLAHLISLVVLVHVAPGSRSISGRCVGAFGR